MDFCCCALAVADLGIFLYSCGLGRACPGLLKKMSVCTLKTVVLIDWIVTQLQMFHLKSGSCIHVILGREIDMTFDIDCCHENYFD